MKEEIWKNKGIFLVLGVMVFALLPGNAAALPDEFHRNIPFHTQESWDYCGPASAQMQINYYRGSYPTQTEIYNYARQIETCGYSFGTTLNGLKAAVQHYTTLYSDVQSYMSYDTLMSNLYNNVTAQPILKFGSSASLHGVVYTGWWRPWYWYNYAYFNDPDPTSGGKDLSLTEGTFIDYWSNGINLCTNARSALIVS